MKIMRKNQLISLLVLLVLVLGLNLFFILSVSYPSYDSFHTLREVDSIRDHAKPLSTDALSYQGRSNVGGGFFYYFVSIFSLAIPLVFILKYLFVVFFLLSLILLFLITRKLFPARWIAILVTALGAFSPSLFTFSLNNLTSSSFFFFLYLLLIYLFLGIENKNNIIYFLIVFIMLLFTSSLSLIFVLATAFYFLLLRLEALPIKKREFELLFFSGTFALWYFTLLFKRLFLNGIESLWQGVPQELFSNYFAGMTLPLALSLVGFIPMILGFYALYMVLFTQRNRNLLFLVALSFSWGVLTWMKFVPFKEGLVYLTLTLVILSGYSINRVTTYFKKTKLSRLRPVLAIGLIVLIFVSFLPVFSYTHNLSSNSPSDDELLTMSFIKEHTPSDATILGNIKDGYLISGVAMRKNFYDENFFFAPQAQDRFEDAKKIFLSKSQVAVIKLLSVYDIDYIYISKNTLKYFGEQTLFETSDCFNLTYQTPTTKVYEVTCEDKH